MAETDAMLWCVVPAAGRGTRVGGEVPKQYLPIAGKPLLMHTLERLAAHPRIAGLMVVLAQDDAQWSGVTSVEGKPVLTTTGGSERAASVLAGLLALPTGYSRTISCSSMTLQDHVSKAPTSLG